VVSEAAFFTPRLCSYNSKSERLFSLPLTYYSLTPLPLHGNRMV
jgi:hypothetical protein